MTYSYTDLYNRVNGMIHKKITNLQDARVTLNGGVRNLNSVMDLKSGKRRVVASPFIFEDVFDYPCPTDQKGNSVIDVIPQARRSSEEEYVLVTEEEFDRRKTLDEFLIAFRENDGVRKTRISTKCRANSLVISEFDSTISGGGTWVAFGDVTNIVADTDYFITGSASLAWDITAAGGTTAGVQNTGLTAVDLTNYLPAGSIFVYVYIQTTSGVTNFKLRIGSSALNYYEKTVTVTHEGLAFQAGWNLLRFDLQSLTTVGSPVSTACNFAACFMTKSAGKISETKYRFDQIVLRRGDVHDYLYYSEYGWQTAAGAYIENSTLTTDLLNAYTEEFELYAISCAREASQELKEYDDVKYFDGLLETKRQLYAIKWPSEAKLLTSKYYNVGSGNNEVSSERYS